MKTKQAAATVSAISSTSSTSSIRFYSSRSGFPVGFSQYGQVITAIYQINNGPITYMWEEQTQTR